MCGELSLELGFVENYQAELDAMNHGKEGRPYKLRARSGYLSNHPHLRARGENVDWMIARSNAKQWVAFSTYDLPALSLVSFRPGLERTVDLAVMAL